MIPADHVSFNDDGTAWFVCPNEYTEGGDADWLHVAFWHAADRPCDTCDGQGQGAVDVWQVEDCFRCNGTGRHTFTIEVGDWNQADHTIAAYSELVTTYRVSVIPGMVLPIQPRTNVTGPEQIVPSGTGKWWLWSDWRMGETIADLPPAAQPGMWAVKLRIF